MVALIVRQVKIIQLQAIQYPFGTLMSIAFGVFSSLDMSLVTFLIELAWTTL